MENTDICVNKYICATAIYLLSILEHTYNIIIDHGVLSLQHSRELVHGLNVPEKKVSINVNDNYATAWCDRVWKTYDNSYLECEQRHQYCKIILKSHLGPIP